MLLTAALMTSLTVYEFVFECHTLNPEQNLTVIISQNAIETYPMAGPQLKGEMEIFSGDFHERIDVHSYATDWTWSTVALDWKYWIEQRQNDDRMFRKKEGAPVTFYVKELPNIPFPGPLKFDLYCSPVKTSK